MDLTGKWRYIENYGYGVAEGELYLKQKGQMLAGRIVFTDKVEGESSYMIQEFLKGELEGRKVRLEAVEFDIIHSEFPSTSCPLYLKMTLSLTGTSNTGCFLIFDIITGFRLIAWAI